MMIASAPELEQLDQEYEPFATRVVSLGPNNALYRNQQNSQDGSSLASLVELEQQKVNVRKDKTSISKAAAERMNSCSDSDENENHSCEDEELVISPEPRTNQAPS